MSSQSSSTSLAGLRVAIFESRMAGAAAEMIRKHGGDPLSAPSLKEVPFDDSPLVAAFAHRLVAGGFDVVIFETGVGVRYLARAVETLVPRGTGWRRLPKRKSSRRAQAGDGPPRASGPDRSSGSRAEHMARDAGNPRRPASG